MKEKKRWGKGKITLLLLIALVLLCAGGFTIYTNDYYRAGEAALQALKSDDLVTVTKRADDSIIFSPVPSSGQDFSDGISSDVKAPGSGQTPSSQKSRGLVFYPGGKVEYTAYAPLMRALAEQGWHCVLLKMPFNLAVFDMDAGDDIPDEFPQIDSWYIGGHSLGGSMAASCAAEDDDFDGLILLASYSASDISRSGLEVYSIYGSQDQVLNRENYTKYHKNLPSNTKELIIEGGCHAYFGDYGPQDGDGIPTITAAEQLKATVDFLTVSCP